jgi:hypothetical protein
MKKCTASCSCHISSIQHLTNTEIGKRISSKLARRILAANNLAEPKLSELLTMIRIIKQLKWSMELAAEVEYITAIEYYQQIADKPTNIAPSELKWWIDMIGTSIVCSHNLGKDK